MARLSTALAHSLVVSSKAPADAKTMALLLTMLVRAASHGSDSGAAMDREMELMALEMSEGADYVPVATPTKTLTTMMGGLSVRELVAVHRRAQALEAGLIGKAVRPAFNSAIADEHGLEVGKGSREIVVELDEVLGLMAPAMGDDDGIEIDLQVVSAFKTRYAAIMYVRCLAWLQAGKGLPRAWRPRYTKKGSLLLDLPGVNMQPLLGVTGMRNVSDIERVLLTPASDALDAAGIKFSWDIHRTPNGTVRWIRVSILRQEAKAAGILVESSKPAPQSPLAHLKPGKKRRSQNGEPRVRRPRRPRRPRRSPERLN